MNELFSLMDKYMSRVHLTLLAVSTAMALSHWEYWVRTELGYSTVIQYRGYTSCSNLQRYSTGGTKAVVLYIGTVEWVHKL